ncbi:MAG: hypothetical protein ACYDDU_21580 [Dermatophilaceae bacterium]
MTPINEADRIEEFWVFDDEGTIHAAMLFAGVVESFCGAGALQLRPELPAPGAPAATDQVRVWSASRTPASRCFRCSAESTIQ